MSAPVGNPAPGGIGLAAPPSGAPPTAAAATPAAPKSNTPDVATGVVPSLRPPTAAGTKPSAMKTTPGAALGVLKAAASAHKPPLTSLKPPYTGSASVPRVGGLGSGGARSFLSPNSAAARLRNATGMKRGAGTGRLADVLGSGARLMKKKKSSDAQTSKEKSSLPESEVFSYLQEYEKRLTRLLNRRKANIKDALSNPPTVKKKLRIYIYNTHANQEAPGEQGEPAAGGEQQAAESREPPSWQLVVYGRELSVTETEAEAESSSGGWGAAAPASGGGCPLTGGSGSDGLPEEASREDAVAFGCHPFSFYMKLLEIQLDEQQYPGAEGSITWRKDQHEGSHHASLVVHRLGSKPVNAAIRLHLDWGHDHYQLKEPLARLLVCQRASRPTVLRLLWNYISMQGLQDAQDRALIRCNPRLRAIFGAEEITAASLPERITSQLAPIEPVVIDYTIRVSGPSPSHPTCFDLDVDMPYSGKPSLKLPDFLHNHSRELEIQACEQRIVEQLKVVREHMRRRTLLQGFAESPIAFINAAVTTQAQEMRMTWSDKDYEACTKSDFFKGKWVEDAATSYLRGRLQ